MKAIGAIAWMVGTLGAALFAALAIHVPAHHYVAAVLTIVFGVVLSAPCLIAIYESRARVTKAKQNARIVESKTVYARLQASAT